MTGHSSPWEQFAHDPRRNPDLRASTADRSTVCDFLAEAYADGRLDREEFEERTDAANAAKTLGQLPPLLSDLAPDVDPQKSALAGLNKDIPLTREEIDAAALEHYRSQRRKALLGIVAGPVGICVAIWAFTSIVSGTVIWFWPLFVILGTGLGSFGVLARRDEIIDAKRVKLTEQARRQLEGAGRAPQPELRESDPDEDAGPDHRTGSDR